MTAGSEATPDGPHYSGPTSMHRRRGVGTEHRIRFSFGIAEIIPRLSGELDSGAGV